VLFSENKYDDDDILLSEKISFSAPQLLCTVGFIALTLLFGRQEGHLACKNFALKRLTLNQVFCFV